MDTTSLVCIIQVHTWTYLFVCTGGSVRCMLNIIIAGSEKQVTSNARFSGSHSSTDDDKSLLGYYAV